MIVKNDFDYACDICSRSLRKGETVMFCADCGAAFCEECFENNLGEHECDLPEEYDW